MMKKQRKWILAGVGIFLAMALVTVGLVVHSYVRRQIPENPVVLAEDQTPAPQATPTATAVPTMAPPDKVITSFSYPGLSLERLSGLSPMIIRGKIVEKSEPFKVVPVGETGYMPYTNYYVEASEFFWGEEHAADPQKIPVRIVGGNIAGSEIVVEDDYHLKVGGEYIFFLYAYLNGGGFTTESEDLYFWVTGGPQGAFPKAGDEEGFLANVDNGEEVKRGEVIDSAKLKEAVAKYSQPPLDIQWIEAKKNLESDLVDGRITEGYYEQIKEEWTQFATIVP